MAASMASSSTRCSGCATSEQLIGYTPLSSDPLDLAGPVLPVPVVAMEEQPASARPTPITPSFAAIPCHLPDVFATRMVRVHLLLSRLCAIVGMHRVSTVPPARRLT